MRSVAKGSGSGNTGYANVRPAHRRDGCRNKSALNRRDLTPSVVARFHTKYEQAEGCWLWRAGHYKNGYGQFMLYRYPDSQVNTQAHRVAYVVWKGNIPRGRVVMHTCDVPACVNPAHLQLGDQADNIADAARKGRYKAPKPWLQKVTDEQVREIRVSKEKSVRLAERYGVTLACISRIRHGHYRKAA